MKKYLTMGLVLLMSLILIACQNEVTIIFNVKDSFIYEIGEEVPNYKTELTAKTSTNLDLSNEVIIDDSLVNYETEGNYTLLYSLEYDGYNYERTSNVKVIETIEVVDPEKEYVLIVFETNGLIEVPDIKVEKGTKINSPNNVEVEGYIFKGWFIDEEFQIPFNFDVKLNVSFILYGNYELEIIEVNDIVFDFYYLNDLHGSVLEEGYSMGLAKIGNYIIDAKTNKPDTSVFLSGGDMLQGEVISNYYNGASVIELLDDIGLDAFVVGNHEFDWGIDIVSGYFNGVNDYQATYPFLGANVYSKATRERVVDMKPYTIIKKSGVKIAVIGTMGLGLESSIAYQRVKDYYFADPSELTGYWAEYVRLHEDADIVVAVGHEAEDNPFNNDLMRFVGNKRIDAIFNGHSHRSYVRTNYNTNGVPINIIQTGSNGSNVGKLSLTYNANIGVINSTANNYNGDNEPKLRTENASIKAKINSFKTPINHLYETILYSNQSVSKNNLTSYISKLMMEYTDSDVALHNYGGTRTDIKNNEGLSYSKLFKISPFDNKVVSFSIKGSTLYSILEDSRDAVVYRSGLNLNNINNNQYYKVATNDYIFDGSLTFKQSDNINFHNETTVLEIFVEVVTNQKDSGKTSWNTNLELIFNKDISYYYIPNSIYKRKYAI